MCLVNLVIHSEPGTFVLDTLNLDHFISISTVGTLIWEAMLDFFISVILLSFQSPRFKKIRENTARVEAVVGPFYGLSFRIQAASYFPQRWVQKNRFNILFGGFSWQELAHSGFNFIGPYSLCRAEDLAAVNHVTQAASELGLKVGFKELRLESIFLNRGLRT